jgi:carbamate kinase
VAVSLPRDPRLLVVALGGKALRGRGGRADPEAWVRALGGSLAPLVDVVASGFRLVLTHGCRIPGNEPASGRAGASTVPPALDRHGAEAQGATGYAFAQALGDLCRSRGVAVAVAAVVTRVGVDPDDPAFRHPTAPVGPLYSPAQARRLGRARGWTVAGRARQARRRVVPAPRPRCVLEAVAIRRLADGGVVTIAAGGGGVPVVETPDGYRGVEAIVQEDATAAVLGTELGADRLVFATGVDQVEVGHRTARAIGVERLSVGEARALLKAREFPAATMGAKIEAAIEFVQAGGREAIITSLPGIRAALDGRAGTHVVP